MIIILTDLSLTVTLPKHNESKTHFESVNLVKHFLTKK
jgi:hypothetical protein